MPKYYCDYCDIFLTHDSPSVRKSHNEGWKHKAAVRAYYSQFEQDATQNMIEQKVREWQEGSKMAFGMYGMPPMFGGFGGGVPPVFNPHAPPAAPSFPPGMPQQFPPQGPPPGAFPGPYPPGSFNPPLQTSPHTILPGQPDTLKRNLDASNETDAHPEHPLKKEEGDDEQDEESHDSKKFKSEQYD